MNLFDFKCNAFLSFVPKRTMLLLWIYIVLGCDIALIVVRGTWIFGQWNEWFRCKETRFALIRCTNYVVEKVTKEYSTIDEIFFLLNIFLYSFFNVGNLGCVSFFILVWIIMVILGEVKIFFTPQRSDLSSCQANPACFKMRTIVCKSMWLPWRLLIKCGTV